MPHYDQWIVLRRTIYISVLWIFATPARTSNCSKSEPYFRRSIAFSVRHQIHVYVIIIIIIVYYGKDSQIRTHKLRDGLKQRTA